LKTVLQRYRDIAKQGGWQPLPPDTAKKRDLQAHSASLAANLARIVFSPYWNIPLSIAARGTASQDKEGPELSSA